MKNNEIASTQRIDALYERVSALIEQGRQRAATAVNLAEVYTKYAVGQFIVQDEQQGEERAAYGKGVLKGLSEKLNDRFGGGWSVETLDKCRKFYRVYSTNTISSTVQTKLPDKKSATPQLKSSTLQTISELPFDGMPTFTLSWNHYQVLMRIDNPDERSFYEIESRQQQWSLRQLKRQVGSSLYEQLALSRDKEEVMRLSREGQTIEKPTDVLKNPLTLEFLQCYVLIDLKCDDLTHQDLGQMQMYVNYYDRYVRQDFEKPTIGILLCETASQPMVELPAPQSELAQEILKDPYAPS